MVCKIFAPNFPLFWKSGGEKKKKRQLRSFLLFKQTQQLHGSEVLLEVINDGQVVIFMYRLLLIMIYKIEVMRYITIIRTYPKLTMETPD